MQKLGQLKFVIVDHRALGYLLQYRLFTKSNWVDCNDQMYYQMVGELLEILKKRCNELLTSPLNISISTVVFRQDLINIAKTTLSSKILQQNKDYFANMAVDAIMRLKGSSNLEAVHIIKKTGGTLTVSQHSFRMTLLNIQTRCIQ